MDRNIRDIFLGDFMSSKDKEEVETQSKPGIDLMLAMKKDYTNGQGQSPASLLPANVMNDKDVDL